MRKNRLLVVVHATNGEQATRNVEIAFDNGADGVFLINHKISPYSLRQVYDCVRREFYDKWIGLNFLGVELGYLTGHLSSYMPDDAQALWCDSVGYDQDATGDLRTMGALNLRSRLLGVAPKAMLFGGLDFKYQKPVRDLALGARELAPYVDVITTSGSRTGSPPSLEKMVTIRQAVGSNKLIAIASGMSPENVDPLLAVVDDFLVSTSISREGTDDLDPARVRMMADKMRR